MTALTLTAANLDGTIVQAWDTGCLAGVALTAGQAVYRDSSNLIQLCGVGSLTASSCIGLVANTSVSAGQPVMLWINGCIVTAFPTLVALTPYYVGASGGIIPFADLTTGNYGTQLGYAYSTSSFMIDIAITGITKA